MTRTILTVLSVLLLNACTAPIEIETKNADSVIVIYGCLTEDTMRQKIKISASSPYFDNTQNSVLSDAVVSIHSSDNHFFELHEDPEEKGVYLTAWPMAAQPDVTYTLSVEIDFDKDGLVETYTASTTMPRPVVIDSITVNAMNIMGYRHYALNLFAQDEPSPDYYLARFVINDTIMTSKITNQTVFSDRGIDGQYINGVALNYFDDKENEWPFGNDIEIDTTFFVRRGDKIALLLSRIEQGYFDFISQCIREKNGENPFFGSPPSNIITNISNGGVGYFTAFPTTTKEAVVPQ